MCAAVAFCSRRSPPNVPTWLGLCTARSEVRAEVNELITQLEAINPNPNPAEAIDALGGSWKLVYTSNSELIALLALSRLPFVTIGDITQKIDTATMTVENKVRRWQGAIVVRVQ